MSNDNTNINNLDNTSSTPVENTQQPTSVAEPAKQEIAQEDVSTQTENTIEIVDNSTETQEAVPEVPAPQVAPQPTTAQQEVPQPVVPTPAPTAAQVQPQVATTPQEVVATPEVAVAPVQETPVAALEVPTPQVPQQPVEATPVATPQETQQVASETPAEVPQEIKQEEVAQENVVEEKNEDEIQTTQLQGEPTQATPDQEVPIVNNIGIESGHTEVLDLNAIQAKLEETDKIDIIETAAIKGAAGSSVIGSINGESATATNSPMPSKIDLNKKEVKEKKEKVKKVKVISKKEKVMSVILTVFGILVLGAAGYAAFYFGYLNNPTIFSVKTINLELGDELPTSVSFYVDSPLPLDDMDYTVDTSQVAYDIVGTYTYTVKHKSTEKSGQIIVKDTKSPELIFKDASKLVFLKDDKILKDDLVESCEDISNCDYKLEAEVDTSTAGEKEVNVIATDEKNNQQTFTVIIKVFDIQRTITCESPAILSEDMTYSTTTMLELNFDGNDELVLTKKYKNSKYDDFASYFELLDIYKDDDKYLFDRTSFSYKVKDESEEIINVTAFNDVVKHYTELGYSCR